MSKPRPPSAEEAFFQRRIKALPAFEKKGAAELPVAKAPSLDDLLVKAPAPEPITEQTLIAYAEDLVRSRANRVDRKHGERVQVGDEAVIDILGYADGRLIPFSARAGVVVEVGMGDILPWLDEALAECSVGDGLELPITLGDEYEVEWLRGKEATFLIDVVSARTPQVPDPDSPQFRELLGPGKTLDEALSTAADLLEGELVAEAWDEARELVLDEVVARTEVTIPAALVDEEIRRSWQRLEAPFLLTRNFEPDEQQEALQGWLEDPATRLDAERRLRLALALKAIAEQRKLDFDETALKLVADEARERFGVNEAELKAALSSASSHPEVHALGLHLRAMHYVLSKAKVRFDGIDETLPFHR